MSDRNEPKFPKPDSASPPTGLAAFWAELKRRKVMRVAVTYAVVAWLIIQVASSTFGWFDIPKWAFRLVALCVVLGFPVALIITWAFELSPDGIKTTKAAREEQGEIPVSRKQERKRNWMAFGFAAAVPTLLFGALALFFFFRSGSPENLTPGLSESEKSIAVLPLDNLSPDPENAFFADGVQEDILTNLSKIEELLVISRSSTLRYRERVKSLKEIGAELGVRYVVEGSVRRAGNRVLVTAQLIEVETDAHLWAENFNRPLDDIFAIQAEVAKTIAGQLHAVISPEAIALIDRRPTENQEAYENYKIYHRMIDEIRGSFEEKAAFLEKAVELDPGFVEAWAYLTAEYITLWRSKGKSKDPHFYEKAHEAYERTKLLEPDSAYVHLAQFFLTDGTEEERISHLLNGLAVDPSLQNAHFLLASRYRRIGRLAEAQHHAESAYRIEPLNIKNIRQLESIYRGRGRWEKALPVARRVLELNLAEEKNLSSWQERVAYNEYMLSGDRQSYLGAMQALPDFEEQPRFMDWHGIVSRKDPSAFDDLLSLKLPESSLLTGFEARNLLLHEGSGMEQQAEAYRGALEYLDKYIKRNPDGYEFYFGARIILEALFGNRSEMETAATQARESFTASFNANPLGRVKMEIKIAMAYLVLGDEEKAIETLEAANQIEDSVYLARELDLWFVFDGLRGNPRFDKLLE
jgi:TolB-like protein